MYCTQCNQQFLPEQVAMKKDIMPFFEQHDFDSKSLFSISGLSHP